MTGYLAYSKTVDHSLLHPATTTHEFESGIDLAIRYDVASVCLMPHYVRRCAERLKGTTIRTSTVIGFPHGGHVAAVKRYEARQAILDGCEELDLVVNVSRVLSEDWQAVRDDVAGVIEEAHAAGAKVKLIFENCYLRETHKLRLCELSTELQVDWVKTSTGFGTSGATVEDVALMRRQVPATIGVKASGGIRDFVTMRAMLEAGANRIGTSRTSELLDACRSELGLEKL